MRRIGNRSTVLEVGDQRRHAYPNAALSQDLTGQIQRWGFPGITMGAIAFNTLMLHHLDRLGRREVNDLAGARHTPARKKLFEKVTVSHRSGTLDEKCIMCFLKEYR